MISFSSDTLRHFFLIAIMLAVTALTHHLGGGLSHEFRPEESALALGFLLLFAFLVGRIVRNLGAPMITGFLLAGILAGPYGFGMVNSAAVEPLRLVNLLALSLIAFTAGGEMRVAAFRARLKIYVGIALFQTVIVIALVGGIFLPVFWFSGLVGDDPAVIVAAALLLAVISSSNSPATAIAVISELRAKGAVSEMIIGVTVFKDVIVILLFGFAMAAAKLMTDAGEAGFGFVGHLVFELGASFILGAVAGGVVIIYLSKVGANVPLFLIGVALVIVELCEGLGISPLIMAITAGFVVENASEKGEELMAGLRHSSLPVFVIFFSLAGQGLQISALTILWPYALLEAGIRLYGMRMGTYRGARWADGSEAEARHAWSGYVGQAGVALGFAMMIQNAFPEWSEMLVALVLADIVINQFMGPLLMKRSLIQAGEVGADEPRPKKRKT